MDHEAVLLHQVHPAKLAADVSASVRSNTLLWQHRLVPGIIVRYLLPLAGSAIVLSTADVSAFRRRASGRYLLVNMPPAAQALRLAGDMLMAVGAWRRSPRLLLSGMALVVAGWPHGLLPATRPGANSVVTRALDKYSVR